MPTTIARSPIGAVVHRKVAMGDEHKWRAIDELFEDIFDNTGWDMHLDD